MWGQMGSYMGGHGAGSGWGLLGMAPMLLWGVLLIAGIAVLGKWLFASRSRELHDPGRRALDILAERYARGEVDKEEYERRKRDLAS